MRNHNYESDDVILSSMFGPFVFNKFNLCYICRISEDPELFLDSKTCDKDLIPKECKYKDEDLIPVEIKYEDYENEDSDDAEEFFDCQEFFDIDLEPEFSLPFKMGEPPHKVALLLDKLVKNETLSTQSYFFKNMKEVLTHLEDPSAEWDPEVCEALTSIQHVGGASALNYVVGPLGRHGAGHHGIPLINYGGPGRTTLQKYRSGTMPVSGTSKHLLLASLRLLELSEMQVSTSKCLLSLVCMQLDGTMLKAGRQIALVFKNYVEFNKV